MKRRMKRLMRLPVKFLGCGTIFFACASCLFFTLFLQTFNILTGETVVAEVEMSSMQSDEKGQYIDIEFTPYIYKTALASIVPGTSDIPRIGEPQSYRIYGDHVGIKGPFIKLHTLLSFLGFENIYKLTLIEGEYRRPENQNKGEGSEIPINGGFDSLFWDVNDMEDVFPYNAYIDRFTFSGDEEPGFVGTGKRRYEIVATFDTITWNLKGETSD